MKPKKKPFFFFFEVKLCKFILAGHTLSGPLVTRVVLVLPKSAVRLLPVAILVVVIVEEVRALIRRRCLGLHAILGQRGGQLYTIALRVHIGPQDLLPDEVCVLPVFPFTLFPFPVDHLGVHVDWREGVGLVLEGDHAQEDGPDILGGVPLLRVQFPTLVVMDWGWRMEMHTYRLVYVRVPHLGQEPKGWWGVRAVDGELEACLEVATLVVGVGGPKMATCQLYRSSASTSVTRKPSSGSSCSTLSSSSSAFCELWPLHRKSSLFKINCAGKLNIH